MTGVHIANQNEYVTSYLKDHHGNIVGYTDLSGRMIQDAYERMDYDAFGNQWNGNLPDPFGYCGEYYDSESGLIYLRNRYYDSRDGRFITEDPVKDGLNWYSYCGGNPVSRVDRMGTTWDYFDNNLPDYAQNYLKELTDEYNNTPVNLKDKDGNLVRDIIHEKAFNYRMQFLDMVYIKYAINDFNIFQINENNYRSVLEYDNNSTFYQALYEYAIALQEDPATKYMQRDSNGNLTKGWIKAVNKLAPIVYGRTNGTPGNNRAQNKQVDDIVKKLGLSKKERRLLHDEITGQNYSYQ